MKNPVLGIGDRKGFPAHPEVVGFYVVNVDWDQLQNAAGTTILASNPIESAVNKIRTYTNADPNIQARGRALKLKVGLNRGDFGAARIPSFVHTAIVNGGDSSATFLMRKKEGENFIEVAVSRWWTAAYMDAYDDLMVGLKNKYDGTNYPEVAEIVVGAATTFFAESFLRQIAGNWSDGSSIGKTNGLRALQAGYTRTKDQLAIKRSIESHQVFVNTPSVLSFNYHQWFDTAVSPKTSVTSANDVTTGTDDQFAFSMMDKIRSAPTGGAAGSKGGLGLGLGVIGNNDYRYDPNAAPNYNKPPQPLFTGTKGIFSSAATRGPLITVQTETKQNLEGAGVTMGEVLAGAVVQGATAVELPGVWPYPAGGTLTNAQLESYNNQLKDNWEGTGGGGSNAPTAPTAVTVVADNANQVTVTFTLGTDADADLVGTRIWRSEAGGAYSLRVTVNTPTAVFVDGGLTPSTLYEYKLRSVDAQGNQSAFTAPVGDTTDAAPSDVTAPTVPGSVTATRDASGVQVSHASSTDAGSGVKEYRYFRQQTSAPADAAPGPLMETLPAFVGGSPTTGWHDDSPLYATVVYSVDATDNAGNTSAYGSAAALVVADTSPPSFDVGARVLYSASPSSVSLWSENAVDDVAVDKYTWTRTGGGGGPVVTDAATPDLTDSTVGAGATYQYVLVAVDAAGNESSPLTVYVTAVAASSGGNSFGPPGL